MAATLMAEMSGRTALIDLSQPLFDGCPGWATYPPMVLEPHCTVASDGFNAERVAVINHTGTHLDVPYHFFDDGKRIEDVPIDRFQGQATILDLRFLQPDQGIDVAELEPFAERIQPDDIVVLCTGWGDKRGPDPVFMYHWPYLTGAGARWLVERQIRAVAIDALSIGGWADGTGRPPHEVLLGAERWILEDIRIPDELLSRGRCYLFAFPILLQGCGGAFVRAVAQVDNTGS
jgi:arylformamidase